jgi:CPA2 family monovalent cation:H+ antiporter-2
MRGFFPGATDADDGVQDPDLPRLQSVMLDAGAAAIGKSIAELDIGREGVFLIALRRGGVRQMEPDHQLCLASGDVLILNGSPENLARAEMRILQG